MGLERYLRDENGFRKYVELLESTPTSKRKVLIEGARKENPVFAAEAEKYLITFDRITKLPEMELTEVLGCKDLKPEVIGVAISSIEDVGLKERVVKQIPRNLAPAVIQVMNEHPNPEPYDVGAARLKVIQATRELEKKGLLDSLQIPRFAPDHFKKAA